MIGNSKTLMFFALVALSILTLPTNVQSTVFQEDGIVFDPVKIEAYLNANGTSTVNFVGLACNTGSSSVSSIQIRMDSVHVILHSVKANSSLNPATLNTQERYSIVTVELSNALPSGHCIWIELELSMTDLQSDSGVVVGEDAFLSDFIFYVRPLTIYENFSLMVFLPPKSTLSQQSVTPLFPQASSNFTDGLSMAFVWNVDFLQSGQEKVFIIRYQNIIDESVSIGFGGLEVILVGLAFLGIGLLLGYFGPKMISKLKEVGRVRIVGITSEEEEVMDALRAKGGSCPQKDLYRDLDMSQAKVSLLLTALEERNLVRRFKDGRENTVHIIED